MKLRINEIQRRGKRRERIQNWSRNKYSSTKILLNRSGTTYVRYYGGYAVVVVKDGKGYILYTKVVNPKTFLQYRNNAYKFNAIII